MVGGGPVGDDTRGVCCDFWQEMGDGMRGGGALGSRWKAAPGIEAVGMGSQWNRESVGYGAGLQGGTG